MTIEQRLERIEDLLSGLLGRQQARQWYSVVEFARLVGRSAFTCREWCRLGRIAAHKHTLEPLRDGDVPFREYNLRVSRHRWVRFDFEMDLENARRAWIQAASDPVERESRTRSSFLTPNT